MRTPRTFSKFGPDCRFGSFEELLAADLDVIEPSDTVRAIGLEFMEQAVRDGRIDSEGCAMPTKAFVDAIVERVESQTGSREEAMALLEEALGWLVYLAELRRRGRFAVIDANDALRCARCDAPLECLCCTCTCSENS